MSQTEALARPPRPARARSLSCPNCGAPIIVRANGISVSAACGSCGSVLDVANPDVRMLEAAQARTRTPPIPIGTRGVLDGREWEVVGFQVRSSGGGSWSWDEYLLYNPYHGFRFLGSDHGTWTLYRLLRTAVSDEGVVAGDSRRYRAEEGVTARTDYVLGEFYWRVKVGDTVDVREFTAKPYVLSQERSGTEVTWSRGEQLKPAVVKAAFKLPDAVVPASSGRWPTWAVACTAVVLLVLLQSVGFGQSRNLLLATQDFRAASADNRRAMASPIFTVPDRGGNLGLQIEVPNRTRLLEVDMAVVSAAGDRRFEAALSFDGFAGQHQTEVSFGSVPGGDYKLLATVTSTQWDDLTQAGTTPSPAAERVRVEVRRHTPGMGYFTLGFLAILTWPFIRLIGRLFRRSGA